MVLRILYFYDVNYLSPYIDFICQNHTDNNIQLFIRSTRGKLQIEIFLRTKIYYIDKNDRSNKMISLVLYVCTFGMLFSEEKEGALFFGLGT